MVEDPKKINPNIVSKPTQGTTPDSTGPVQRPQEPVVRQDNYQVARFMEMAAASVPVAALVIRVAERMVHDQREGHRDHDARSAEERGTKRPGGAGESPETAEGAKKSHRTMATVEAAIALKAAKFGGKERSLSPFETTLLKRFEQGVKQAKESLDGQFHFLKKSAGEWTGFFEKFVNRTMQKVVNWEDVQGLLFRGLLQEKGASQKGVMISDVMTALGTDKFARISVAMSKAQQLAAAMPGAMLSREALQGAVLGEQLRYLALNPQLGEEGAQFAKAASRGMFASQQLESRVAEHLGLLTDFRGAGIQGAARDAEAKRAAESRCRRGGIWSSLFGDEVGGEGSVFVPWWSWNREERSGFRRWFVVVFGSVIFVALFFLIIFLVRAFR